MFLEPFKNMSLEFLLASISSQELSMVSPEFPNISNLMKRGKKYLITVALLFTASRLERDAMLKK
jgi:hypothetical protein